MPRTLDDPADQDAVRKGATAVGATVVEGSNPIFGARNDDSCSARMYQFHLVHAKTVGDPIERHGVRGLDVFLTPLARIGVTVVHPDLIAKCERPPHPAASRKRRRTERLKKHWQSASP